MFSIPHNLTFAKCLDRKFQPFSPKRVEYFTRS